VLSNSQIERDEEGSIRALLDAFGDLVAERLALRGIPNHRSLLFRKFSLVAVLQPSNVVAAFAPMSGGGMPEYRWHRYPSDDATPADLTREVRNVVGWDVGLAVAFPISPGPAQARALMAAADDHVRAIQEALATSGVRGIERVPHLVPFVRTFLRDHPDPARNVLIMMRFGRTDQLDAIHATLRSALEATGMTALRADDKDYTQELWTNLEVYMTGCEFGIAVFEQIDQRDFNPNVSLELGYMLATGRRCLLLKEQRLPTLPADVVHRLYKEFDAYHIEDTVGQQVRRWVSVDLGLAVIPR
jgi:hypothetical protein